MKTNKKELTLADLRTVRGALGDQNTPAKDDGGFELRVAEPIESSDKERSAAESRAK